MDGSAVAVKVTRLRSRGGGAALGGAPPAGTSVAGAAAKAARRAARSAAAQFHREVRRYARLRHPGIVQFLGVVDGHPAAPGELLLVTELMDGGNLLENLRAVRRAGARLDDRSLLHLAGEVAWAVVYLHREGFSNGDLKSLNVALTEEIHAATGGFDRSAHAKLIDFGLSRALAPDTLAETVADSVADLSTSTPSSAAGTLHYLSPEALRSPILQCDPALARKGDVYALGVVLYELLTTLPPWAGVNPASIPSAVFRAERPAWPPALATDAAAAAVSPAVGLVRELAEACWSQDPDARPDADVVASRLDAAARMLGPDTRPRRAAKRKSEARAAAAAQAAATAAAAARVAAAAAGGGRHGHDGRDGSGGDGGLAGLVGVIEDLEVTEVDDELPTEMQSSVGDLGPGGGWRSRADSGAAWSSSSSECSFGSDRRPFEGGGGVAGGETRPAPTPPLPPRPARGRPLGGAPPPGPAAAPRSPVSSARPSPAQPSLNVSGRVELPTPPPYDRGGSSGGHGYHVRSPSAPETSLPPLAPAGGPIVRGTSLRAAAPDGDRTAAWPGEGPAAATPPPPATNGRGGSGGGSSSSPYPRGGSRAPPLPTMPSPAGGSSGAPTPPRRGWGGRLVPELLDAPELEAELASEVGMGSAPSYLSLLSSHASARGGRRS
ncbi:hypothetical protein MMPV_007245 [Pyropia vietnamensis]